MRIGTTDELPGSGDGPNGQAVSSGGHKSLVEEKRASSSLKLDSQLPRHDVAIWTEKALAFCRWCHEQLISPSGADVRTWLETERGLHVSTIEKFGLGWNPRQFFRTKRDWGLDDDGKMALPSGLVVPKISADGRLVGVTIRRLDDAEAQRWGKYHVIPSPYGREIWTIQQEPMDDPRRGKWPLVIVEGELDGLLLAQECVDINIAVLGSAGRKPHNIASHRDFWLVFTRAQKVFLCLDNDEAGQQAMSWWLKQWTHTVPLPPPGGHKDPTEAYLAGHDLKGWLLGAFEEAGIQGWPLFSFAVDTIGPKVRNKQQFRLDSWKI